MIADAVRTLRKDLGITVDPNRRGPVTLDRFFDELNLTHLAMKQLNLGRVMESLRAMGIPVEGAGDPNERLAGFLFASGRVAKAFVNADDIVQRRRFTAAHELGHAVLHREVMGQFIADASVNEADEAKDKMEREADQFAAELLMPSEIVQARAEEMRSKTRICHRGVLVNQLASELLVSPAAMGYRLKNLGVGDD